MSPRYLITDLGRRDPDECKRSAKIKMQKSKIKNDKRLKSICAYPRVLSLMFDF